MSKRLILLAILFVMGIAFVSDVYASTPGYSVSPGTGEIVTMPYKSDAHRKFRLVRVSTAVTTTSLPARSIVVWDLSDDDGISVDTSTTSGDSAVAGVIAVTGLTGDIQNGNNARQDEGNVNWTWLQTYGKAQVDISAAAVTEGYAMGTSTTAGKAMVFRPQYYGSTAPQNQGYAGFFYDSASASAVNVSCFVRTE